MKKMKKLFSCIALLAILAMAAPAIANQVPGHTVTLGGRISFDLGWQILPKESIGRNNSDSTIANFFSTVNGNTMLRAIFTSADKTTGAHIEFGLASAINRNNSTDNGDDNVAYTRFAYGWWDVGTCKLLVGQFAGRLGDRYFPNSNIGFEKSFKANLAGFGFIGGGSRNPKVALQVDVNDNFGFEVAIGQAGAETTTNFWGNNASTNSYLPRLEVVLDFKFGEFVITPGAGIAYQQWKEDGTLTDMDDNVLSYLLWVPVQYTNGPFTVMFNAFYGQNMDTDWNGEWGGVNNWGNTGGDGARRLYQFGGQPGAVPMWDGNDVEDTQSWGVGLAMDYALTDQLSISLGGGINVNKNDAWVNNNPDNRDDYTRWGVYLAMPYKVTSNFTIAPEVAYYNYGDRVEYVLGEEDDAGDEWLVGIHFEFNF